MDNKKRKLNDVAKEEGTLAVGVVQNEEAEAADEDEELEEEDDELLEAHLTELATVQENLDQINDEASDAVLAVEKKFNEKRRPVYQQRNESIAKIPNFWLTAFCCHPLFAPCLTEADKEILAYLQELDVEDNLDVKSGFSIAFKFSENPFFHDNTLAKYFKFADDGTLTILGAKINWKENMDVTKEEEESFFKWFYVHECLPNGMQDEIATTIKEDLWQNPVRYFHGADMEEDEEDDDEGEEEEEEEEAEAEEEEGDE